MTINWQWINGRIYVDAQDVLALFTFERMETANRIADLIDEAEAATKAKKDKKK